MRIEIAMLLSVLHIFLEGWCRHINSSYLIVLYDLDPLITAYWTSGGRLAQIEQIIFSKESEIGIESSGNKSEFRELGA